MSKRAVEFAMTAVLLLAIMQPGPCDSLRVDLGLSNTALAEAVRPDTSASLKASAAAELRRQAIGQIALPGFSSCVSSGDPALPCKVIYIALPPDADPGSVRVDSGSLATSLIPGSFDIGPVPAAATSGGKLDWGHGKSIAAGRNARVYRRNAFYPAEHLRIVHVGSLRTWKVVVLEYWPYAYNPVTGRLKAVASDGAHLQFARRRSAATPADPVAAGMSGFIENNAEARVWYAAATPAPPPNGYAIVTTNAVVSASAALADFIAFKKARGFGVRLATETEWGGGTGNVAAENIRSWLKRNYIARGFENVLLIGNPDPTVGDVPMKMLWPRHWSSAYRDAPSDYYYADLTGNWDRDGDGFAGEEPDDFGTDGIDRIPEVYVGRIPCYGSVAELDRILRKTMAYESGGQGDWTKLCLMAMKPMDSSTPSYQLGEQIAALLPPDLDLATDRLYDESYHLDPEPEHYPCSYDAMQAEWSHGAGLVFWMTHGSYNTAGSVFLSSRCPYLDDSRPSIVYMASCSNGQPEYSGSLGYCVLARGGVSTFSASRVSWYFLGQADFTHTDSIGGIGYQYARGLTSAAETCGRAAFSARLANPLGIWPNHLVFNLYGDPTLAYNIPRSIGVLKQATDGMSVRMSSCVISRMGDGPECYVQDANRCGGIRLTGDWGGIPDLSPGSRVTISGLLDTENGMRVIRNGRVTPAGGTAELAPVAMPNRAVGDPKSLGLLVAVWGRVVSSSVSSFVISDGSLKSGLKITCHGDASAPSNGYVRVTGISTTDGLAVHRAQDIAQAD